MSASDSTSAVSKAQPGQDHGSAGFHTTHWTAIITAGRDASEEAVAALESLCRTYWYPLYAFSRRQGQSPADSEDLTQQFFAGFLERRSFESANPERGRFRNYLLASFKNFLANEHHRRTTAKRGGRFAFVSLEDTQLETHFQNEPSHHITPEHQYDHSWAMTLLAKVANDLKCEYQAAGKGASFDALEVFLTGGRSDNGYETIAASLGVSESAVKMAVMRLRQRYGVLLRREIAQTLNDPSGVDDELRHLLQSLSPR